MTVEGVRRRRTIERAPYVAEQRTRATRATPHRTEPTRGGPRDHTHRLTGGGAERIRPEVREGTPTATPGGGERIGAAAEVRPVDARVERAERRTAIGASVDGVTFRPGIQSETSEESRAEDLLTTLEFVGLGGDPLQFQIGDRTYTAAQLRRQLEQNSTRFTDFLRAHGISRGEFNQLLDDIANSDPEAGTIFDLRPGSALADAYRIGGDDGATYDFHLDPTAIETAAAGHDGIEDRLDVGEQEVEGPSFWQMIADAFREAIAWIGRLFGSTWDPDTMTFDGRLEDEDAARFRQVGRDMVEGRESAIRALFAQPDGAARVREELLSQRPESIDEQQWARAMDETIAGMREGLGETPADAPSAELQQRILVYLRANDYSADAQAQVDLVLAQPPAVRDAALSLLVELPPEERATMLALFAPLTSEDGYDDPDVVRAYQLSTDEARYAIFETMRRDGFRHGVESTQASELGAAIETSHDLPADLRERYLAMLPRVGQSRMPLITHQDFGLLSRMRVPGDDARRDLFDRFERHLGNSIDAISILEGSAFSLELTSPRGGTLSDWDDRRDVREAFERTNTALDLDGETIDVGRYLSDETYRRQVLTTMIGTERPTTQQLVEARRRFDRMLRNVAGSIEAGDRPNNVRLDISEGSQLHTLFRLGGQDGPNAQQQLARRAVIDGLSDITLTVRGRGRDAPTHTITREQLADVLRSDDPEATFAAQYPGLDLGETVFAMARIDARADEMNLPGMTDMFDPVSLDLTSSTGDRELDRIGQRLRDRRVGNVRAPGDLGATLRSSSDVATTDPSILITDSELGGVAGNNWFQYGIFTPGTGSFASRWAFARSQAAYDGTPNPAHPLSAIFDLDGYGDAHDTVRGLRREDGIAHGRPEDFLSHPETGAPATGADFQVISLIGQGMGWAGVRDARRVTRMFTEHGGVPESQTETYRNPTRDEFMEAVRAEIMRDPRPADDRDGPRTVVVYYSGHTGSYRDNEVSGLSLRDGDLRSDQIAELQRLAQERGVHLMLWTDACRSGEYVHQARQIEMNDLDDAGALTDDVRALAELRQSLADQHVVLSEVHRRRDRGALPGSSRLARMGAAALRGGDDSDAMRELIALRDRIEADPNASDDDKTLIAQYVGAIQSTLSARAALEDVDDLDPDILTNGLVSGENRWRPGRRFSSFTIGRLADLIGAEMRDRLSPGGD